jgi:GGDEF domain-containing protein
MSANLGILKMLESPTALPDALLKASSASSVAATPGGQAEAMRQSLLNVVGAFRAEAGQGGASVEDLLAGMYNMRAELLKAVKAQQGLAQHLSSKEEVEKAADDVFVSTAAQLVMSEYQRCKGNPKRMAQVIQRIVPDRHHLQKVLAVFRAELQKQGAPLTEFYSFLAELNTLLWADQSYREFLQAGQDLGVSPDELLRELQADPRQAAHLIVLASEARRLKAGSGEDLVQSLTDYVDKAGDAIGERIAGNPKEAGRLSTLLQQVETEVNRELQSKAMPDEVRQMGQQKLRHRLQRSVTDLKGKAILAQLRDSATGEAEKVQFVLELFSDEKEMEDVMSLVRETLDQESLAKDVGDQVMAKVRQELAARRERAMSKELPTGVYVKAVLDFFVKMEISRAARYDVPFTLMLLSFQGLPEDKAAHERHADALRGLQNVLIGDMRRFLRDSDFVGYLSFNRFLVVLPMTKADAAPAIVRKLHEHLTRQVALPDGSRLAIRPRCGLAAFDKAGLNSYQKLYGELTRTWQGDQGRGP